MDWKFPGVCELSFRLRKRKLTLNEFYEELFELVSHLFVQRCCSNGDSSYQSISISSSMYYTEINKMNLEDWISIHFRVVIEFIQFLTTARAVNSNKLRQINIGHESFKQ